MATSWQPLKKRSVVSSFILKYDGGVTSVALFRRSGKVSTYRHHLAPISGSIDKGDASPLAAAWRELREETTLGPPRLELLRQGKAYTLADESVGREWTIYPFAFRLRSAGDADAIQIDWEHEGWGWYDPLKVEDSEAFGGVPKLAESLRRVYFEKDLGPGAGALLADGLEVLKSDHQSGARQLAGTALRVLRDVVERLNAAGEGMDDQKWWANVRFAAWHVWKNGRESMGAAIMSVLVDALEDIEDVMQLGASRPANWREIAVGDLDRRIARRESANSGSAIAEAFATYVEGRLAARLASGNPVVRILTLSDSSTITLCLHRLIAKSGLDVDLRVLESRPLYEGVSLAASIAGKVEAMIKGGEAEAGKGETTTGNGDRSQSQSQPGTSATSTTTTKTTPSSQSSKLSITICSDASAALAAEGCDFVLIGADRISASGAVSNKTGSLPAILSAKHVAGAKALAGDDHRDHHDPAKAAAAVQVVAVSESEKVAPPGDPREHVVEGNDPAQLARAWASGFNSERVKGAAAMLVSKAVAIAPAASASSSSPAEGTPPQLEDAGGSGWRRGRSSTAVAAAGSMVEGMGKQEVGVEEEGGGGGGPRDYDDDGDGGGGRVKVTVKNVFFEWVPPQLVDVYITERGVWTVQDIAARSHALGAEWERLFQDF